MALGLFVGGENGFLLSTGVGDGAGFSEALGVGEVDVAGEGVALGSA